MKTKLLSLALLLAVFYNNYAQPVNVGAVVKDAEKQTDVMLKSCAEVPTGKPDLAAPRTLENGQLKMVAMRDWTSGFFAGELWYLYQYTKNKKWADLARQYTQKLQDLKYFTGTHDLGFMVYCSYGNGYRLTKDTAYRAIIIQAAKSLSTRFRPVTGVIKSWDFNKENWQFPVIIDNMMNLELLFNATRFSGDSSFYKIAVTHANTTLKNHFRPNGSCFHLVDYDTTTGAVRGKQTVQGYSDSSAWARGQAWGLYGFTVCYRETKNKAYLQQADKIAAFLLRQSLPADKIPYWDYNDPQIPAVSRDASAAAITAAALYELSKYSQQSKKYKAFADALLQSLTAGYRSPIGENKGFLLLHSTGHRPAKSEVDVPLIYADYYYLEALIRSKM